MIGRGIPNQLSSDKRNGAVPTDVFPPAPEAAAMYAEETGSCLTDPQPFAASPFANVQQQQQCEVAFNTAVPSIDHLLDCAVNRNFGPFKEAILTFVDLVRQHSLW